MNCPQCGAEYREGFTHCSDCDVDLVAAVPEAQGEPDAKLVRVWEGGNPAVLPLVESLLRDAGIEFLTRGESLQDLFALGRMGTGASNAVGPVEFWVREEDQAAASELLASIDEQAPSIAEPSEAEEA